LHRDRREDDRRLYTVIIILVDKYTVGEKTSFCPTHAIVMKLILE